MHAEVMAIGDELTSGERLDTNSQWLSQQLGQLGIAVRFHTTVGDDLPALTAALRTAAERAPLVFITGGLGPTADDLTRQAIAEAAGRPLELDAASLALIRSRFADRGRDMPAQNRIQAMFPVGCRIIPNPHGTAPGIDLDWPQANWTSRLVALPGVPAEMVEMWRSTVAPAVAGLSRARQIIYHRRLKCFGVGESQLESMLPDLIARGRDPRVGITVHRATITLRITTAAADVDACRTRMQPTIDTIHQCLGTLVYGEEDDELEHAVLRLLEMRGERLVVAELGTQGLVARWLSAADTSGRLLAGLVVPSRESLERLFPPLPESEVPEAQWGWLAERLRERFSADLALAIGPLPEDPHSDPRLPVGLASTGPTVVTSHAYRGHPDVVQERAAKQALDLVRRQLLSLAAPPVTTPR